MPIIKCIFTTTAVIASFVLLSVGGNTFYHDRQNECDLYNMPSSKDRVCKFNESSTGLLYWYTGTLDKVMPRCTQSYTERHLSKGVLSFCPGYVGMRMSLWCDFDNGTALIYKDGKALDDHLATVTFNKLQKEDEGVYRCIRPNGSLIGEFNLTVRDEIHIGGANIYECVPFQMSSFRNQECCYYSNWIPDLDVNKRQSSSFSFAVYGDGSPEITSISSEWYTPQKYHYPTDLGMFVEKNISDPVIWTVNYYHDPHWLTTEKGSALEMAVKITVSNHFSSSSFCVFARFQELIHLSTNISLPQDVVTSAGGVATFTCLFEDSVVEDLLMRFKLDLPTESFDGNSSSLTTNCSYWNECEDWTSIPDLSTKISLLPILEIDDSAITRYSYEITLTNVDERLNGSIFSCSVSTFTPTDKPGAPEEFIEWVGSAELVVGPAAKEVTTYSGRTNGDASHSKVVVSITVPLNLLLVFCLLLIVFLVVIRVRRVKMHLVPREPAQVPLTDQSFLSTSQSTINSEVATPLTEEKQLPAISIFEVGEAQRDVIVGEILPETRSMDSGVICTDDYDNSRRRPNSLQMTDTQQRRLECVSPLRLCHSEADIIDTEKSNLRLPPRKLVVYISYTDSTSRWVRTTLKPLIDSWNIAEVMIPDRDMVAGKAISDERRRLIVEADKIILVISPDYYDSDWCSYELMHAIQSEPTLSRGRIIPILIDGCQYLPQNMEVVVPLLAHELNFSIRLKTALSPQHRLSQ